MPEKTTPDGHSYAIDGRDFIWTTEEGATVTIPMRVKLKVVRKLADSDLDPAGMFAMLDEIAPGQADVLDEMDIVTDFQPMFRAWQEEYNALNGASLGE